MDQPKRYHLALVTYWSLFIIAPSVVLYLLLGRSKSNVGICIGVGMVLIIIGERGFRPWKRLWKVDAE